MAQCGICPHNCDIKENSFGFCGVRTNIEGRIEDLGYGIISSVGIDPIEKKPLYHFYPGKTILSAGFFGCNLKCPFCQNHSISQSEVKKSNYFSPGELVEAAVSKNSFGIAFTYSEPLIHHEYLVDTSVLAADSDLKTVLITNGFINPDKGDELLNVTDAANIDLKSFSDDFYRKELKGKLQPVLDFITAASEKIHIEITTLIIPRKNDSPQEMEDISTFISELSPDIPLHLSAYYPNYKYRIAQTDPDSLLSLVEIARKKLKYVYPGNIMSGDCNTTCSKCGNILVKRTGYHTELPGINEEKCSVCGASVPFIL